MAAHLRPPLALRFALCAVALAFITLASPAAARADSLFAITGRGWGHGIGMTQYGALGYAQQGKTYSWILAHYFQETTLSVRPELTVKVDLDAGKAGRSSWWIAAASSSSTLTVQALGGVPSVAVTGGAQVWITFKGGGAVLSRDKVSGSTHTAGSVVATFPVAVTASTGSTTSSRVRIMGKSGPFSNSDVSWRGQIRFTPDTTTGHAIDYVAMEQYLRGVVPRESPSSWPSEALRAQAVAARSYAYGAAASGSTLWCTTMSQVYNGVDGSTGSHEAASTDAAVRDTADQCVVYGSTVVQTFFSSSSGGRTASIQDVWPGSTPEPYYTGVTSGEPASSPNYRWSLADMSGTTMAGTVRRYSASLAQPSPATVTTVTVTPAASGFVLRITLKWSNGKSTTLTGSQFKSALGLKSTAFNVVLKNPPAIATALTLRSGVASVTAGVPFPIGGAMSPARTWTVILQRKAPGASTWVALRSVTTSPDGSFGVSVQERTGGVFRYRAVYAGTTGWRASTSATVTVAVAAVEPPVWKRYEQTSSAVVYRGTWRTSVLAGLSGRTHAYSHVTGATAVFTFTGTQVRWIGTRAACYGKAWVRVDSSAPVLVDLYAASTVFRRQLFQSGPLTAGAHRLTVKVAGTKNARATYHYVDVDAFDVLQATH